MSAASVRRGAAHPPRRPPRVKPFALSSRPRLARSSRKGRSSTLSSSDDNHIALDATEVRHRSRPSISLPTPRQRWRQGSGHSLPARRRHRPAPQAAGCAERACPGSSGPDPGSTAECLRLRSASLAASCRACFAVGSPPPPLLTRGALGLRGAGRRGGVRRSTDSPQWTKRVVPQCGNSPQRQNLPITFHVIT